MSISGSLQDVSVADVMQFIHLGRRTGTLVLTRGRERALIGFHLGKLVSARAPGTPKLGELLLSFALVDPDTLQAAVGAQERAVERRTLGHVLVAAGAIEPQELRYAVMRQIEQAVSEVIAWDRGSFEFAVGDLRPVDDVALYPGDVIPDADLNTQMVLLEAARIFDERSRLRAGAPEEPGETAEAEAWRPPASGEGAQGGLTAASRLGAAARVQAALAAVDEEEGEELERLFAAPEPVSLHAVSRGPDERGSGVARLRRVFGDLRSGLISATVALNLMHIISESVERAVLFLVDREQMAALGAFGSDHNGKPLAERTRGLKLPLGGDSVLSRGLETGEVQSVPFEEARLPEPFRSLVGRPKNGQVVVFPVFGAQRVISVIYTDNGEREEPVEDIDILELATAQAGMAFENELLRRQISQNKG